MGSVRTAETAPGAVSDRVLRLIHGARAARRPAPFETELLVLDVVFVLGVIALFVLVGFLAEAVEKL